MRDRTNDFNEGDYFYFKRLAVRGPDVKSPKGTKGATGQHSMSILKYYNGTMKVQAVMDPFKEKNIAEELESETEPAPGTPAAQPCHYEYCPYDQQQSTVPWRLAQQKEEEKRKQEERTRRESRQKESK